LKFFELSDKITKAEIKVGKN